MTRYTRNPQIKNKVLPVDIVLGPSWWNEHTGMTFDRDFFLHPAKRVESERRMEQTLYERWGQFGLGAYRNEDRPEVGPVHLAAGYLLSEMLGCQVDYNERQAPQVVPARQATLEMDPDAAFQSSAFKSFQALVDKLKLRYGRVSGDADWGGLLNIGLDLRGESLFIDMVDQPGAVKQYLAAIANVIERFVAGVQLETGTSSITINRSVRHIQEPVFLHPECSHTMISEQYYEAFLLPFDIEWSRAHRPFGVHYCGDDPHRYAESFAKIPHLDFLDLGWGGNVRKLREYLPGTFLNIRLSPVKIVNQSVEDIRTTIRRLVTDSANPWLTGLCCINIDHNVPDQNITAIFQTVEELRQELVATG